MTVLYLIRHGETNGNVENIFHGHTDAPLNENGIKQAEALKERFKNIEIDALYSSPLQRTMDTARAVNFYHGLPIITDERLMEMNGGDFEGVPFEDINNLYPEEENLWCNQIWDFVSPNGEGMRDVFKRSVAAISDIVSENKGKKIAVVSHGCPIRCIMTYLNGYRIEEITKLDWVRNSSVTKIVFDDNTNSTVDFFDCCEHFPDSLGF